MGISEILIAVAGWVYGLYQAGRRHYAEREAIRLGQGLSTSASAFEKRQEVYLGFLEATGKSTRAYYTGMDSLNAVYEDPVTNEAMDEAKEDFKSLRKSLLINKTHLGPLFIVGSAETSALVRSEEEKLMAVVNAIDEILYVLGNSEMPSKDQALEMQKAEEEHASHGELLEIQMREDLGVQNLIGLALDAATTQPKLEGLKRLIPHRKQKLLASQARSRAAAGDAGDLAAEKTRAFRH